MGRAAALVVGNGEPPSRKLFEFLARDHGLILCADGGANIVQEYGFAPDYIVGDLDSVDDRFRSQVPPEHLIRVDADDTGTDLQKVLWHAVHLEVKRAMLVGFTGRRTDHTLWNLALLKTFADRMDLRMADDHCDILLIRGSIELSAPAGLKVSLCPLAGAVHGICTDGLRFPLLNESLIPGQRDGISNEVVGEQVSIEVAEGDLLLILQRRTGSDIEVCIR